MHRLEFYAIDRLGIRSRIINILFNILISNRLFGINNNDRILTTKKYPNNYPNSNPPSIPFPNQLPVATRFQEIKDMGLNVIRINMYWEGYRWYKSQGQTSTFLNRVKEIADTADSLGLGILYNVMHQWKVSSVLYSSSSKANRGAGFPEEALKPLGLVRLPDSYVYDQPIDGSTNVEKQPKNIFWKNFVNNYNITVDGITKPIWQHIWDDYYKDVVIATKDHPSTIGYELLNEPLEAVDSITTSIYRGLGNYNSFIAQNIRKLTTTNKKIFFAELISWRHNDAEINSVYPDLAGKNTYYKKAELTVRLMLPRDSSSATIISNIAFSNTEYGKNGGYGTHFNSQADEYDRVFSTLRQNNNVDIPILITEWNEQDPAQGGVEPNTSSYINYLSTLKTRGYGWFFFNYDPNYPWSIKDSNYNDRWNSTRTMTFKQMLIDALFNSK
ncbi:MAG: cellulase family glycosylhydrolase [Candidatus Nitrosocaldaceae archaeon]